MKPGDAVEVSRIWAHGEPAAWFGGYRFVEVEPRGTVLVAHLAGTFEGVVVRYRAADVRPAKESV